MSYSKDFRDLRNFDDNEKLFFLINVCDEDLATYSSLSKDWRKICYEYPYSERLFKERSKKYIKKYIEFKDLEMRWIEFYIRVKRVLKSLVHIDIVLMFQTLLEIKIFISEGIQFTIHELEIAAEYGNLEIVKYFVLIGINQIDQRLVNLVSGCGRLEVVKYFISIGIKPTEYGAQLAAINGKLEMLKYLVSIDIKPNRNALNQVSYRGYLDVLKYLVSIRINPTEEALIRAAEKGNLEIVKYLISIGINPKEEALTYAIEEGRIETVRYLISIGVKLNYESINLNRLNKHPEMIEYLESIRVR